MEPQMDPKIHQNPSMSPPDAQDELKVPPRLLPDLQNEPSGLQNEPPDLKNESLGSQKLMKIRGSDALTEDQFLRIAGRISCHLPPPGSPKWLKIRGGTLTEDQFLRIAVGQFNKN